MAETFDPYRKWLGIAPKDQPPNHYRLLGIDVFESDPDVISSAADQRMAHVRTFQIGKHSEVSQRILNEISRARLCLLDPEDKRQYDAALRDAAEALPDTPADVAGILELGEGPVDEALPDDWDSAVQHHAELLESLKAETGGAEDQQSAPSATENATREDLCRDALPGEAHVDGWGSPAELATRLPIPGPTRLDKSVSASLAWKMGYSLRRATFKAERLLGRSGLAVMALLVVLCAVLLSIGPKMGGEPQSAQPTIPKRERGETGGPDGERLPREKGSPEPSTTGEASGTEPPDPFHVREERTVQRILRSHGTDEAVDKPPIPDGNGPTYRRSVHTPPEVSDYLVWGRAFLAKHQPKQAVPFLSEAIARDSNNAVAHRLRGHAHLMAGEFDQALADFTKLVQLTPFDAEAYNDRGLAHEANGDLDEAIADFTEAIRLDQACDLAYINRGAVYQKKGEQAKKAEADFVKAKELGYELD